MIKLHIPGCTNLYLLLFDSIIMNLEEEFGISVPEEEAVNIKTVSDIVSIIEQKQEYMYFYFSLLTL